MGQMQSASGYLAIISDRGIHYQHIGIFLWELLTNFVISYFITTMEQIEMVYEQNNLGRSDTSGIIAHLKLTNYE